MKSLVVKHSIIIAGHKTSVSLEDAFWTGLKQIALSRKLTLPEMVAAIDTKRVHCNLSSALRLFVLDQFRGMAKAPDMDVNTSRSRESGGESGEPRSAGADAA